MTVLQNKKSSFKAPFPTPETVRGMGTGFWRNNFWYRLYGQPLLMIG